MKIIPVKIPNKLASVPMLVDDEDVEIDMFKETNDGQTHYTCNKRPIEDGEISSCCGCSMHEGCEAVSDEKV